MRELHVIWDGEAPAVWAERPPRRRAPPGYAACSVSARELLGLCRECFWYADGFAGTSGATVALPTFRGTALPPGTARGAPSAQWRVATLRPSPANLLMFLSDVRERNFADGIFLAPDTMAAAALFRAVARMAAGGRYLPDLAAGPRGPEARWIAVPEARDAAFLAAAPPETRAMHAWLTDAFVRRACMTPLTRKLPERARFETFQDAWLAALRAEDALIDVSRIRPACSAPAQDAGTAAGELAANLRSWRASIGETPGARASVRFALSGGKRGWRLAATLDKRSRGGLLALGQAIPFFPALAGARAARGGASVKLSPSQALDFMRSAADDLRAAGYRVETPSGVLGEHIGATAELVPEGERPRGAEDARRAIAVKLSVRVDGEPVTESELRFLLDQGESLVFFRNRWIEVDRAVLREALRALESRAGEKCSLREAAAFAAGSGRSGRLGISEVKTRGWLRGLLNELRGEEAFRVAPPPAGLNALLRPYQKRGAAWLSFLAKWGFGACLADDMGLGKTVQTLAALLHLKADGMKGPALVAAPLTVLPNWKREIERFAPSLRTLVHSGPARLSGADFRVAAAKADVVLVPYSLVAKDFRDMLSLRPAAMVLDEAQAVKNPDTRISRAVRALDAPVRIALTGTPLENRVSDLWAIEDFLNPGLLGTRAEFEAAYARAHGSGSAAKLRKTLAPFILRRLKTDPGVAKELGKKRETREYCELSPEQRALYEQALAEFARGGADAGEKPAPGEALALITRLKEICDAPQLAGAEGASGKADRLEELVETFFANGESCLVFTQYAKAGAFIRSRLYEKFGFRAPFLHGALSPKRREEEIAAFCGTKGPAVFILSLRAGGFGLNLVKATRVVHFDRWWNPAVENQAADRAYRIGQTKDVFVHTFICAGTVEDRVDRLLEEKRRLAEDIVGGGESFLLKMTRGELLETAGLEK